VEDRVTVVVSVLADGRKLTPFIIMRRKDLLEEKLLVELCVNETIKGG
jgi:hypothetical protein